ncbi:hypothetical protein [Qipengyuania vesicularis]|uniref:hypothetical protein n=1 Tax=Qipengyuania vesicularis TaxID=2867232 RepID=UPI001C88DB4E|nr:hypothetical protein [Qipengyuania vesicularis]MBX7526635.1 hypothetical protein [Qipengyuania vesicularis]
MLASTGCSSNEHPPTYRYRLTVEVDTPEGLKTGSSVIEVEQRLGRAGGSPAHSAIRRRARGEAVAIELPGDRTLFALLRSEDSADWAAYVVQAVSPTIRGEPWEEQFDNMLQLRGERIVPRYFKRMVRGRSSGYPLLVTFTDLDEPSSLQLVDPDDLATTFGEDTSISRVTVQMTEDPVTTGIEQRLRWLPKVYELGLVKEDFPDGFPVGDFKGLFERDFD